MAYLIIVKTVRFNYNNFSKKNLTKLVQKIINVLSINTNINIIVIFNYIEFFQKYYNTSMFQNFYKYIDFNESLMKEGRDYVHLLLN